MSNVRPRTRALGFSEQPSFRQGETSAAARRTSRTIGIGVTFGASMTIELSKDCRKEAIASIERYFRENMEEKIGNVAAGGLLNFVLEEIGPSIYNKAVADVQERLQQRVAELDIEIHEEELQYWRKFERQAKLRP